MTTITLKGQMIHTSGTLPAVGSTVQDFVLAKGDLSDATLDSYKGKKKLLNIFVSLDTGVCAQSVRKFAESAAALENVIVLNISKDLPFAQGRFCVAEGLKGVETLSAFRSSFAKDYGLEVADGGFKGLCSRAVIVLDESNHVLYVEQVPEIAQEPDYSKALAALKGGA